MGFSSGFLAGAQVGKMWSDVYDQGQLRKRLEDVDNWKVEDIPEGGLTSKDAPPPSKWRSGSLDIYAGEPQAPDTPTPDKGLAPPAPPAPPAGASKVVGYRFGGQVFTTKPPKELQDAIRTEQRAIIHGQLGDADKAELYHQAAITQREKAITTIADRAFSSGSLPAIFNALSTIDDGLDYRYEVGKNGAINVFTNPDGSPDKSTLAKTFANEKEAVAFARNALDPKLVSDLATAEQNRAYQRSMMDYNQASLGLRQQEINANAANRQDGLDLRRQQQADLNSYRQQQELGRKFQYYSNMASKEPDAQRRAYFLEEAAKVEAQMAGVGGDASATGIYNYLTQEKGIDPAHAVGIVTSVDRESGFNPTATHDGNTGYGLMGHRLDRRDKLFASAGTNAPNWKQQIDYALTEPEMQTYLSKDFGGDYKAAAGAFTSIFEKPANTEAEAKSRADYSTRYAGLMNSGSNGAMLPSRQYAEDNPFYQQAQGQIASQQEQMRLKNQKPPALDDWLKLQGYADSMAQSTPGYADMSPAGQAKVRDDMANTLWNNYQATQGGLSGGGGLSAPRPTIESGAAAVQARADGGNAATQSAPKLPKTGTEAASLAQQQATEVAKAAAPTEPDPETKMGQSEALHNFYMIARVQTTLARSKESPEAKKAIAQDAIDKVTALYDQMADGNKPMAVELLTKLYSYVN